MRTEYARKEEKHRSLEPMRQDGDESKKNLEGSNISLGGVERVGGTRDSVDKRPENMEVSLNCAGTSVTKQRKRSGKNSREGAVEKHGRGAFRAVQKKSAP